MKNIVVIGAGYVGLVTGACFAQKNNRVIIVEHNQDKIARLLDGKVPFYEPGLDAYVSSGIQQETLIFVDSLEKALAYQPELIFSCVGTPSSDDGSADLSQVWAVAHQIGQFISQYCVVVNKSTVPVGTALKVEAIIQQELTARGVDITFDVASNPEFLKEGDALNDFVHPDRVVIGVTSERAKDLLWSLYQPFLQGRNQFFVMNRESAELTKYAANAMLATRISFMNQIALLADKVGADIDAIKQGIAADRRIGGAFLNAGIGYGGSCFPKDVKALVFMGNQHAQPMSLVQEVDEVNTRQRLVFINAIIKHYGKAIAHKTIGIWGLAFKPETDDIRYSPALDIIPALQEQGARIVVHDPIATENVKQIFKDTITYATNPLDMLHDCDCLVLLTDWKQYLNHEMSVFTKLNDATVFDGRNCYDPKGMMAAGITYRCIGKNSLAHQNQEALCDVVIPSRMEKIHEQHGS